MRHAGKTWLLIKDSMDKLTVLSLGLLSFTCVFFSLYKNSAASTYLESLKLPLEIRKEPRIVCGTSQTTTGQGRGR